MSVHFVPYVPARRKAVATRPGAGTRIAWCALLVIAVLEAAVLRFPARLLVDPVQLTSAAKQWTGYGMLALMAFAMVFGSVRRLPALARHHAALGETHQLAGLAIVVLLAVHLGQRPTGFLQYVFHVMAAGVAAGALRAVLGARVKRAVTKALLALHIASSCAVFAAVLLHLYFVYAYTA